MNSRSRLIQFLTAGSSMVPQLWKCRNVTYGKEKTIKLIEHVHLPQGLSRSLEAKSARALRDIGGSGPAVVAVMPHNWP